MRTQNLTAADSRVLPRVSRPPLFLRGLLVLGMTGAVGVALAFFPTAAAADPALARLLRGMALIKAVITLGAAAAVFWRLGRSTSPGVTAAYVGSVWLMTTASVLIWQLSAIGTAAVAFHVALISLLVVAWRDDRVPFPAALGLQRTTQRDQAEPSAQ